MSVLWNVTGAGQHWPSGQFDHLCTTPSPLADRISTLEIRQHITLSALFIVTLITLVFR